MLYGLRLVRDIKYIHFERIREDAAAANQVFSLTRTVYEFTEFNRF